jgi:hypothetical protein
MSEFKVQKALGTTKQFWVAADIQVYQKPSIYITLLVEATDEICAATRVKEYFKTPAGLDTIFDQWAKDVRVLLILPNITIGQILSIQEQEDKTLYQPDLFQE